MCEDGAPHRGTLQSGRLINSKQTFSEDCSARQEEMEIKEALSHTSETEKHVSGYKHCKGVC